MYCQLHCQLARSETPMDPENLTNKSCHVPTMETDRSPRTNGPSDGPMKVATIYIGRFKFDSSTCVHLEPKDLHVPNVHHRKCHTTRGAGRGGVGSSAIVMEMRKENWTYMMLHGIHDQNMTCSLGASMVK